MAETWTRLAAPAPAASEELLTPAQTMSPAVRRAVLEHGVDPSTIKGTGKDGRLTKEDVLAAAKGGVPAAPAAVPAASAALGMVGSAGSAVKGALAALPDLSSLPPPDFKAPRLNTVTDLLPGELIS